LEAAEEAERVASSEIFAETPVKLEDNSLTGVEEMVLEELEESSTYVAAISAAIKPEPDEKKTLFTPQYMAEESKE